MLNVLAIVRGASLSHEKRQAGGPPRQAAATAQQAQLEDLFKCSGEPVTGFLGAFFTLVLDVPRLIGSFLS